MRPTKLLVAVLALAGAAPAAAEAPRVAVSIAPIHSLAAAVMAGAGDPTLIVDPRQSEHTFQLKPSHARILAESRLVIWVGPALEPMFERTIGALPKEARVLTVTHIRGLALLQRRTGVDWEDGRSGGHDHGAAGLFDPHVWLDPDNAGLIVEVIRDALVEIDPPNAYLYTRNAARTASAIQDLDRTLRTALAPLKDRRFIVFHDGYQYFERHYDLAASGAIALSPEASPGARRLSELRERIRGGGIACVFAEPQFSPALVETVTEGLPVRTATLDALGFGYAPGPALWFDVMRGLARSLAACLS